MHPKAELMCFKSESSELWLIKTLSIEKDNDQDSNPGYDFCFFWLDQPQCHQGNPRYDFVRNKWEKDLVYFLIKVGVNCDYLNNCLLRKS